MSKRPADKRDSDQSPVDSQSNTEDAVLRAADAVARGDEVDWDSFLESTPASQHALKNLRSLATISGVMRAVGAAEANPEQADTPDHWGHLKLLEELGRGSFGKVFRAFDSTLQRDVAVKLRRRSAEGSSNQGWIEEARRLARVRHPNVLAVHGADTHDGVVGLWSDLVVGRTLEEVIRVDGRFSVPRTLNIAIDLASALNAVHKAGIVHGDLKPANVMLQENGQMVLMDFGAGSQIRSDDNLSDKRIGSPLVMAPEQLRGIEASPASDAYSFGVLLYRMLTASYPIKAKSLSELSERHSLGKRTAIAQERKDLPRPLSRLIEQLLDPDPAARPSIGEAFQQLKKIQERPHQRRRRLILAAVITLLAVGLAVSVNAYLRASAAEQQAEAINSFLLEILAAPRGAQMGSEVKVVEVVDVAAERMSSAFIDQPDVRMRTLLIIGRTYFSLNQYERARPYLREALEIAQRRHGEGDVSALDARYYLVGIERQIGDSEKALEMAEELLRLVREHRGDDDQMQVQALTRMGMVLSELERHDDAEAIVREAVKLRDGPRWRDDSTGNQARLNLSTILNQRGSYAEAEALARRVLTFNLEHFGERHANTVAARHNIVMALNYQGRFTDAESVARRNHETVEDWLSPQSTQRAMTAMDLSNTLYHLNRQQEALELDKVALRVTQHVFGAEHVNTLRILLNMANRQKELGDIQAAEAAYLQAISEATENYGGSHSLVMMGQFNLSELYLHTDRPAQALELAQPTYEIMLEKLGPTHLFSLVTEALIGASLSRLGRHEDAETLLRDALKGAREHMGMDNDYTLDTALYLAEELAATGKTQEARRLALEVMQRRLRNLGEDHPKTEQAKSLADSLSPQQR